MEIKLCPKCGKHNNVVAWNCVKCGETLGLNTITDVDDKTEETETEQQSIPEKPKSDKYYEKGWKSFGDALIESDKEKGMVHLSKAHGYLTMAYTEAGNDIEAKKGIAGLAALILTQMNDCKNAEDWARKEFAINKTNIWANLAWYFIELDKLVNHKRYIADDTGGVGTIFSVLSVGVDVGRVQSKRSAIKEAAIEAARLIEDRALTDDEPNPVLWFIWSIILLSIIENMWTNNMKEPYLCRVLLNLPWTRFTDEELEELDLHEVIDDMRVEAHGYLGRLK